MLTTPTNSLFYVRTKNYLTRDKVSRIDVLTLHSLTQIVLDLYN